jgi:17 kDa outer membrane surface antigen
VVGTEIRQIYRRLYRGSGGPRLWRGLAAALTLGFACGGCSMTGQLDSLFPASDKSETTGSIGAKAGELPPDTDLVFTRAAVSEVLSRFGNDSSVPWENPRSGARGTVTPIASAYSQDGQTCRDFLASYVQGKSQAWLQGEACRQEKGVWEVRTLKPWKRS